MKTHAKHLAFAAVGLFGICIAKNDIHADTGWQPVHDLPPYTVEAGRPTGWLVPDGVPRLLLPSDAGRFSHVLDAEELLQSGVSGVEELVERLPGAARQSRFGVMTVPTVRGDAAETLFNGQRRGDNLFGMPLSLTPLAGIEMVNGVGLLATGPGKRSGGQLNLVTISAASPPADEALLRLGTWVSGGGSFGTVEGRIRSHAVLGPETALAIAAGWRENATYYHRNGGEDNQRDLYLTLRRSTERGQFDLVAYFQEVSRPQTLGVNRPWQGLIDKGLYISGSPDAAIGRGDPPGFFDPGLADPGLLTAGPADLVPLEADRVLMSVGDVGKGGLALMQALAEVRIGPDLILEQALLFEQVHREKLNQFYYAEDVEQRTLDSMTRLKGELRGPLRLEWEAGLHLRREERDNRANYWNEFAYAWDIAGARRFNALETFAEVIAPGAIRGNGTRPWYVPGSLFSTPESSVSRLEQAGLHATFTRVIRGGWTVNWGGRLDRVRVVAAEAKDLAAAPLEDVAAATLASGAATLSYERGAHRAWLTAANAGGVAGNTVGDGINLYGESGLHTADLDNRTRLVELGFRTQMTEVFSLQGALFSQRRQRLEFFGSNTLQTRGAELFMEGQLGRRTRLSLMAHYLDARYDKAAPAEFGGGSVWNVFAPGAGPTGLGNGLGYTRGFFLNSIAPGNHRVPGLSRWEAKMHLTRSIGERWEARLQTVVRGPQSGNLAGEFTLPRQTEWTASVAWNVPGWEVRLVAFNFLNATNWIHNGDTYFDQLLISRSLPRRLELWVRRQW